MEAVGVTVEDIIASPLAASFNTLTNNQKAVGVVLVNVRKPLPWWFMEGLPITVQVLPIGSADVTNDIALGLRLPLEEAEKLKIPSGKAI